MRSSRRWSKRYDVKVVPRRYLHLYRCFGWTPTSPVAMPQYDWERKGPNSAAAYTSADISLNLQDYDDLGLQRKELIAVKRNTKFYQYKKQYPSFFKDEKMFDKLMNKYTVSNSGKRRSIKQVFSLSQRIFDIFWTLISLALIVLFLVPDLRAQLPFDLSEHIPFVYLGVGVLFCLMATRRLSFGKKHVVFTATGGEGEDFTSSTRRRNTVVSFLNWWFLIPGLFFIFVGVYSLGVLSFIPKIFPEEVLNDNYVYVILLYAICSTVIHILSVFRYNPYAWIKMLCLRARPVTKKILFSDISMMSAKQRQRYQQGRIISAAVSDALDKRANGIHEDFYIGY